MAMAGITARWYRSVLSHLAQGARVLDVGIGTGGALSRNAAVVRSMDLSVVGLDIDPDYVARCRRRMADAGLSAQVKVVECPIQEFQEGSFDAIYFSASFMLIPNAHLALRHATSLLAPGGKVFFTQTFQLRRSTFMEKAKPLLHKVTTIHFGQVTYEQDFLDTVSLGGVRVLNQHVLDGGRSREARLVIAEPHAA